MTDADFDPDAPVWLGSVLTTDKDLRNEAFEEAAKVAEEYDDGMLVHIQTRDYVRAMIAAAIRALKT